MQKFILIFFVTLIAGCSTGTKFVASTHSIDSNNALVYVYRPLQFDNALLSPDLIINNKRFKGISNGGYFSLHIQEGEYQIKVDFGDKGKESTKTFKFENGKTYFIKANTGRKPLEYPYELVYFRLDEVESSIGKFEIKDTRLIEEINY